MLPPLTAAAPPEPTRFDDAEIVAHEAAITDMVGRFYQSARADAEIGPVFEAAISDWDHHLAVTSAFWSRSLLKTDRFRGFPYPVHMRLPLEPAHFDRWLALFVEAALTALPAELAAEAIVKAAQMAEAFKAGLFPPPERTERKAAEREEAARVLAERRAAT